MHRKPETHRRFDRRSFFASTGGIAAGATLSAMPRLARAERAAERAYRAGAISYLDWAQLQSERTATQRQQLDAALEAQAALIEIQRLTGQPFVADAGAPAQGTTP